VYTNSILNIVDTPEPWGDKLLTVEVYAADPATGGWSRKPVATGDRGVWAKGHSTNVLVFRAVAPNSEAERAVRGNPRLAPGRYLLKYFCDTTGVLNRDYRKPTNSPEFYQGQQVITTDWPQGWGSPIKVAVRMEK
jgi:hypothetical protein